MSEERKAGALILSNIGMFDEATRLLDDVEDKILQKLCDIIEKWKNVNGWEGECCNGKGLDIWLAPPSWGTGEEDEYFAFFDWNVLGKDENQYWVTTLCGEGGDEAGFRLEVKRSFFGGKSIVTKLFRNNQDLTEVLSKLNFKYRENDLPSLPVKVDKDILAKAYAEDDCESALEGPIVEALERIKTAFPYFDKVIQAGKINLIND